MGKAHDQGWRRGSLGTRSFTCPNWSSLVHRTSSPRKVCAEIFLEVFLIAALSFNPTACAIVLESLEFTKRIIKIAGYYLHPETVYQYCTCSNFLLAPGDGAEIIA